MQESQKPVFLEEGSEEFQKVRNSPQTKTIDYYDNMVEELKKIRELANANTPIAQGKWVYFPWNFHLVKILDHEDFFDLRTARNKEINTKEEQEKFRKTVVGIAGLSVGNSAAVAIAYSGGSETMKIADPDTLDGSNLNRIRAGIKDLGENKTFIAAKQIYELNPYANLILYPDGLTPDNLKDFLLGEPKLNIVVDEMDNLKMKIFIRLASRSARLPVIMATDNGDNLIIDVDRFDQNPYTPPFNELPDMDLDTIAKNISFGEKLDLTLAEKIRLATNIVGAENVTPRMQDSLMEVGKTLISWPQLAVAAFTSGTTLSYIAKKIAVGEEVKTGKSHLSLDESFLNLAQKPEFQEYKKQKTQEYINYVKKLEEEDKKENFSVWETKESDFPKNGSIEERLKFILNYAVMAPSAHNTQPWKFKIQGNSIEIFVDKKSHLSVSDPSERELYLSIGTLFTNLKVAAANFGFNIIEASGNADTVAKMTFQEEGRDESLAKLFPAITKRLSNRSKYEEKEIPSSMLEELSSLNKNPNIELVLLNENEKKEKIAQLISEGTELIMKDTEFRKELSSWLRHNFTNQTDGMPGFTMGMDNIQSMIAPFLIKEYDIGKFQAPKDKELVLSSPVLVVIGAKDNNKDTWLEVGQLYEKITLLTTLHGISNATLASVVELGDLPEKLVKIVAMQTKPQMFFRLGYSNSTPKHSPRRIVQERLVNP